MDQQRRARRRPVRDEGSVRGSRSCQHQRDIVGAQAGQVGRDHDHSSRRLPRRGDPDAAANCQTQTGPLIGGQTHRVLPQTARHDRFRGHHEHARHEGTAQQGRDRVQGEGERQSPPLLGGWRESRLRKHERLGGHHGRHPVRTRPRHQVVARSPHGSRSSAELGAARRRSACRRSVGSSAQVVGSICSSTSSGPWSGVGDSRPVHESDACPRKVGQIGHRGRTLSSGQNLSLPSRRGATSGRWQVLGVQTSRQRTRAPPDAHCANRARRQD